MIPEETKSYKSVQKEDIPLNWRVGQVIAGLYKVEDTTAGGMGAVYFVKHMNWGIPLAVKTPLPDMVKDEAAMKRFIREAETWVNIGIHPHIATCYYVRVLGGLPRIFIEYVDGGSLKEWLKGRSERDLAKILDIAIQICWSMDYVHGNGVIHRDLKPANCLITKGGIVKVTDFGIAKVGEEIKEILKIKLKGGEEGSITITGSGFGTPEYMAPEQFIDAKHVSKAADIYSFGVMLFEMVCGRRPFVMPEGMHPHPRVREAFYKKGHQEETPPDPVGLRRDCPKALSNLILGCLEKFPEKRLPSFRKIEEELLGVYEEISGETYLRKRPDPLKLRADAFNNRAVSLLELEKEEEAERYWDEALQVDPAHLASTFNVGYYRWRREKIDGYRDYYLGSLKGLERTHGRDPEYWYTLAVVEAEIGLVESSKGSAQKSVELGHKEGRVKDILALPSPLIRIIEGHTGSVDSVAISPDGRYALSGSGKTLRLWEIESGKCLRVFEGHTNLLDSVAISPDGRYVLSGSSDKTLRLWELSTGKCLIVFEGHTDHVTSVAISPGGQYAISGGWDQTLRLWELSTGKCLRVFEGHTSYVNSVVLNKDGRYALSGSVDHTLRLWEIETGKCLRVFRDTNSVNSVAISPGGKYAISANHDNTLRLWEIETGKCLRIFEGHILYVNSVALSPDGRYVLSGSSDKTLRLWELSTGKCLIVFEGHTNHVTSVAISPGGKYAISGGWDQTLRLWELSTGKCLMVFEGHTSWVTSVAISLDGKYVISGSRDKTMRLWELDWHWEFPEPSDWNEGARPYLEILLHLHPNWTEEDFQKLLYDLQLRGYGWLKPEGVRKELEKMSKQEETPYSG